jgi:hypothetical protein
MAPPADLDPDAVLRAARQLEEHLEDAAPATR